MKKSARQTDRVIIYNCGSPKEQCKYCSHGPQQGILDIGPFATTTTINNLKAARLDDMGTVDKKCPHGGIFKITRTCVKTYIDGKLGARFLDEVTCQLCQSKGHILQPLSPDTFTET